MTHLRTIPGSTNLNGSTEDLKTWNLKGSRSHESLKDVSSAVNSLPRCWWVFWKIHPLKCPKRWLNHFYLGVLIWYIIIPIKLGKVWSFTTESWVKLAGLFLIIFVHIVGSKTAATFSNARSNPLGCKKSGNIYCIFHKKNDSPFRLLWFTMLLVLNLISTVKKNAFWSKLTKGETCHLKWVHSWICHVLLNEWILLGKGYLLKWKQLPATTNQRSDHGGCKRCKFSICRYLWQAIQSCSIVLGRKVVLLSLTRVQNTYSCMEGPYSRSQWLHVRFVRKHRSFLGFEMTFRHGEIMKSAVWLPPLSGWLSFTMSLYARRKACSDVSLVELPTPSCVMIQDLIVPH